MESWIRTRTPLGRAADFLRTKQVPVHRHSFWYLFGGLTLFFLALQIVSGVLLTLYYVPTPDEAHRSVAAIVNEVRYGWAVRAVHVWSSHLVILCATVHLASKFFFRAYRAPRELTWISGVFLLLILLAFAFTGHLLPWDTVGYFATQIGTEIPRTMPLLGPSIVRLLRGAGEYVDATALTRMYSLHTVILPLLTLGIAGLHLLLPQHTGSAAPAHLEPARGLPFLPDVLTRDALAWIAGSGTLLTLVLWFPPGLGPVADTLASPPAGIHPEWYFLPLFQTINLLPGAILGINTEIFVNTIVALFILGVSALPWLDRHPEPAVDRVWPYLRLCGYLVAAYGVFTILLTYLQ